MIVFFTLLSISLLVAVAGFVLLDGITWKEFLLQVGAQILVAGAAAGIIYSANTHDTEIWNGYVTGKKQVWVSCSHSYSCNCRQSCSGSGKDRSCHEVCDTCYEHTNDWDWNVYNSIGETFTIGRVDRRGLHEPQRWTAAKVGEPTSSSHWFTNYVKAAPGTLFRHQGLAKKYEPWIPEYPGDPYDYYRLNRTVLVNEAKVADRQAWDAGLAALNARLGAIKQVNLIVVLAKNQPIEYFSALEEAWIGGKKNDVILVVGVDGNLKPQWASVMAWTLNEMVKVKLRDDIMDLPEITHEPVLKILGQDVSHYYQRKPMADFEYLAASITPTTTQWVVSTLLGLLIACGLTYWMHREDLFSGQSPWARKRGKQW